MVNQYGRHLATTGASSLFLPYYASREDIKAIREQIDDAEKGREIIYELALQALQECADR